jgi:hypothetical protein
MFKFDGLRWIKIEDNLRMDLSNTLERRTYKSSFINNTATSNIDGEQVQERQSLSNALRPKKPTADN